MNRLLRLVLVLDPNRVLLSPSSILTVRRVERSVPPSLVVRDSFQRRLIHDVVRSATWIRASPRMTRGLTRILSLMSDWVMLLESPLEIREEYPSSTEALKFCKEVFSGDLPDSLVPRWEHRTGN